MCIQVSSWQIPPDILEQRNNQENEPLKEASSSIQNQIVFKDNGSVQSVAHDVASKTGALMSSSALDLIKRKLHDSSSPVMLSSAATASTNLTVSGTIDASLKGQLNESSKDKEKETNGDANVSESSSDSDEEDSGPSKEECIVQFKVPFFFCS